VWAKGAEPVDGLQLTLLEIREQCGPEPFRLAHEHAIAMLQRFFGQARNVHAAHDDLDAAAAKMRGDFISARCGGGHRGDADQIGLLVQVQRLDAFIDD
jgi:hypothetical protein